MTHELSLEIKNYMNKRFNNYFQRLNNKNNIWLFIVEIKKKKKKNNKNSFQSHGIGIIEKKGIAKGQNCI